MDEQEEVEVETGDLDNSTLDLGQEDIDNDVSNNETDIDNEKEELKKSVNYERKLRKQAEKEKKELEARISSLEQKSNATEPSILDELLNQGIEEGVAKSIIKAIESNQGASKKTEQDVKDLQFELAIAKASKNPELADIENYTDEIKTLVDKGLTVEQSYYAITGGSNNTKSEIRRELEAKLENKQARQEILGKVNNNSGTVLNKAKIKATPTEIALAKSVGMSIEEYINMKNVENLKDYEKLNKKK